MSDFNKIYEKLGSIQADVTNIKNDMGEIKSYSKETRQKVELQEGRWNKVVGYCVAAGAGAGTIITFIPKALSEILK